MGYYNLLEAVQFYYATTEQPIDSSNSTHQRFLHSHSRFDDEGLDKLAIRYQQNAQQRANLGSLTGNIRHLQLPSAHHIDGNPYLTDPISLVSIHQHINNHIPADWLGIAAFDPITLQPNTDHGNDDGNDNNVHHISACYLPFPHHHHIPYGEQLATLGQPHPSLTGLMSASIIDTDSSAITHDRNHRAHIRYHWQSEGDDSAHWIPIASHLVADHMGQTHPLRHGQHVLIDFIGGDITHPIIIGSTHNGQGNTDAQHNSIVSDTDAIDATSPAWFINQSHAHPIDGIKTQSIDSSRTGEATKDSLINGYNQLMFDAHPNSPQINVYSSSFQSSLTIGHLYQHSDHTRGQARGQGISIETQAAANVQGSTGIHISSQASDPLSKSHMSHDSHSKLQTADQHQQAYAQLADTHQPVGLEGSTNNKQSGQNDNQTPFGQFSEDTNDSTLSESGQWQQANLLIDSQRHLALLSGQHSQYISTQSTHSHATDSTHHHSQTQMNQLVAGNIHYYSNKAQTHTAAHGDVTIQAHQEQMRLDSEQVLRIHSRDSIEIIAPDTLTLKAAGSGIEISGGNVTFITPSQVGYKASKVDWGSGGSSLPLPALKQSKLDEDDFKMNFSPETVDSSLKPEEDCPCNDGDVVKTTAGGPVNVIQGCKVLFDSTDLDYAGKGYLPFALKRMYNSQNTHGGWFGQGWTAQGYEQKLEVDAQEKRVYLIDNTGRRLAFDYPKVGESVIQPFASLTLYRLPNTKKSKSAKSSNKTERFDFILYQGVHYPTSSDYKKFQGAALRFSQVSTAHGKTTVLASQMLDRYGHSIELHYTRTVNNALAHLPTAITDSSDHRYQLSFELVANQPRLTQLNQVGEADQPTLKLARYSYNDKGDLIEVYRHEHLMRKFAYTDHIMTWQQLPNGLEGDYVYDQTHDAKTARVIKHTLSNGLNYQFDYGSTIDKEGVKQLRTILTEQQNSNDSRSHEYRYDDTYILKQYINPLGHTTRLTHDHLDRLIKFENPKGGLTEYHYDGSQLAREKVLVSNDPKTGKPHYRTLEYKYAGNQLIALKDALGNTRRYAYNDEGMLIATTDPLKHTTKFSYDNHGNLVKQTLANGSSFKFEFDNNGNLITQTDCSGYQTQNLYDDEQRIEKVVDAEGNAVHYYYDDSKPWLGTLVRQVDYPDGNKEEMQYNDIGHLIESTDASGNQTIYHYDLDGLPTKRLDAKGNSLKYSYDSHRRLSQLTNENDEHWTFDYDKGDNLVNETRFDGHQSQYRFDVLGNLIQQIDNPHLPSNQQRQISYERDLLGQVLTQNSTSADQTHRTEYQFDKVGQLICATNPHSRIDLAYDANGQLIKERQTSTLHIAGLQHEYSLALQHQYDELGNRTATTLPDGKVLNQLYYGSGHLYNQSLFDPSSDQNIEIRHSERNKLHVEVTRQQGVLDSAYTYDPMGRLINQNSSYNDHIVVGRQYQYDLIGQLTDINSKTSLTDKDNIVQQHTRNHHYQYDAIGRLTEHKLAGQNTNIIEQFAFDPASNRVPAHSGSVRTDKKTQAQHQSQGRPTELISQGKRVRYTYDSDGRVAHKTITANSNQSDNNLIQFKKELAFSYNANNELSQTVLTHHKSSDIIVTTTQYYYDAFGRRIHKHSEITQGYNKHDKHTHMLWDGNRALQDYVDTNVYTTIYDQGSFEPIVRAVWPTEEMFKVENDDSNVRIEVRDSTLLEIYHYHNDQLGTPNELTNDKGEVIWLADYEAWGNTAKVMYNEKQLEQVQVTKEHLQPIRFQGQVYDEETGLHYNRFRYYDPDMGMFTSRDPIGLMGGNNVFAYAPNPIGWLDPLGLKGGSLTKAEAMNQARVMGGDGPLCNIAGVGCNDNHLVCTSATYKTDSGKHVENFKTTGSDAIPTNVFWPPTPSYVDKYGGDCTDSRARTGPEYTIRYPKNTPNLPPPPPDKSNSDNMEEFWNNGVIAP